jgi:outer membrane biosynthesis protein TonB
VEPDYPDAARALGLDAQRCVARIEIDAEGEPARVEVTQCPAVFHRATEEALLQWRWIPVRLGGERIPVVTTIAIVYRLD